MRSEKILQAFFCADSILSMAFRSEEIQIRLSAFEIAASHDFIVQKYGKSKKSAYDNHEVIDWHMCTFYQLRSCL